MSTMGVFEVRPRFHRFSNLPDFYTRRSLMDTALSGAAVEGVSHLGH